VLPPSYEIHGGTPPPPPEPPLVRFLKERWPFLVFFLGCFICIWSNVEIPVTLPPGVRAGNEPQQVNLAQMEDPPQPWQKDHFWVHPLASYRVQAKVLSKERYRMGTESELAPYDLALGWQQLSDQAVVDGIEFSQGGRWYSFRVPANGMSPDLISLKSANPHVIPANDEVLDVIADVRRGDIVELEGYLVKVTEESTGWSWKSSTTRRDRGAHACEVFWVSEAKITTPE
jgi:hypothetical protein